MLRSLVGSEMCIRDRSAGMGSARTKITRHLAQCTTGIAGGSMLLNRKGRAQQLLRGKVVLYGCEGSGKSSLMHRWIFPERYSLTPDTQRQSDQEKSLPGNAGHMDGQPKKWSCNSHTVYHDSKPGFEMEVVDMPGGSHLEYGRVRELPGACTILICLDMSDPDGITKVLTQIVPELVRNLSLIHI
eukprot:TRINITY_DN15433_c0_g1_i4.p1 TRINITY_DN15433_c0_g1~~TRINITY_DN15433_c0_g1_i4.p1  ORF type:complete len:186 (-),score=46.70 TRINITY_DN15433_c0_g1_i4:139-696(-)